ncbi:putative manganese efflux pump MntP [Corallococcus sp. CAG:1435]|uniref:Putative manganese efflux pump MntP n=1 Tax=Candidatus Fimimonas gallinarum TaxID=2840821 RepID=A0A9D1E4C4_9BACT|nr:putative manganese efflux pump MntP [Corallococcus sp. CAG:1435]HIR65970.1 manganese efflux pump [Candidatus Fimimonas gallinarum]
MWWKLILNSILLGVGLAMDACAVSMANGLNDPNMKVRKVVLVALIFAFFQALMPMIGWICVRTVAQQFDKFTVAIPYIALALLGFIGGKMIYEGVTHKENSSEQQSHKNLTAVVLLTQAVATSIDALSVGFTVSSYDVWQALTSVAIIALVTFAICVGGVYVGKKFGTKLGNKAEIFGGIILIGIGLEIFITGVFFPAA